MARVIYLHARPKGCADWRPHGRTLDVLAQVEEVLEQYAEHWPLTLRQIFYRLVALYGYEKTERAYKRLGEYLTRARRAGRVPWEAMRDDGWVQAESGGWRGPEHFGRAVLEAARGYVRDKQAGQPRHLVLLVEAAGMVPQLRQAANPFSVPVMSSSGFDSLTVKKRLADQVLAELPRPTVFLHVGDLDPSGVCIFDAVRADVEAFVGVAGTVYFERVALTPEQVRRYGLPTAPPKPTDKRGESMEETCQAEALPPDVLLGIVREAIEANTDSARFEEDLELEKAEREEVLRRLGTCRE
ncbi:MAG: hypothetical protein Q8P50_15195 [Bacillota bacterium]|nr:hypothetical protein [Bacillota bacterium]